MSIKFNKIKALGVLTAVILVAVFGYYISHKRVGAENNPEARIYRDSGEESTVFSVGEEGDLDLRIFAEGISGTVNKADIAIVMDASGSMEDTIQGTGQTKLERAKDFANDLVDQVSSEDQTAVVVVWFDGTVKSSNLTSIEDDSDKDYLRNFINDGHTQNATAVGKGVQEANNILVDGGREDAQKYIILLTDGGENRSPYVNNQLFADDANWIDNPNAPVNAGSILEESIENSIKIISIYINVNEDPNDLSVPVLPHPGIVYGNAGLMRFLAAKTNENQTLSITSWNTDFGTIPELDNKYMYLFKNKNIYDIYRFIQGADGAKLDTYIKLPSQVDFNGIVSSGVDKGGRAYRLGFSNPTSNSLLYKMETSGIVPVSYQCNDGEQSCIQNAVLRGDGTYWIENNYLDIKVKVKFNEPGNFDLLGNYINCETGPLQKISEDSKVDYFDTRNDSETLYKTLYFNALCIKVIKTSPSIVKVSYESDPGDDLANPQAERKASFEAGDDVWIVLEISNNSGTSLSDWKISDRVPDSISASSDYWYYQGNYEAKEGKVSLSGREVVFKGTDSGDMGEYIGQLSLGKNYIKYRYKI